MTCIGVQYYLWFHTSIGSIEMIPVLLHTSTMHKIALYEFIFISPSGNICHKKSYAVITRAIIIFLDLC